MRRDHFRLHEAAPTYESEACMTPLRTWRGSNGLERRRRAVIVIKALFLQCLALCAANAADPPPGAIKTSANLALYPEGFYYNGEDGWTRRPTGILFDSRGIAIAADDLLAELAKLAELTILTDAQLNARVVVQRDP